MARNTVDNSQINLSINAQQANSVLDAMRKKADSLRKAMEAAANAGDAKKARRLAQQLRQTEAIISQCTRETSSLEEVMRRLDQASPKELRKTLSLLQRQISTMRQGTKEFQETAARIRRVREEMSRLNQAMSIQRSAWQRFNGWLNECQTFIVGVVAALSGLVSAGKKAVQEYAEIEQEMANVRKFTGMTAKEVEMLNEEFLKINTRTSREELNKLAQEAGRLGKTSQQDVLGFVRAADKINVALDDLGQGATLKLSKLTGIFGDEQRYGTEQSLLKVGSVINELSQNCSASAPYIADFTERLGGVGAQAGMTIQQIMGFAAVLDSNAQKVEASATALSQVIVRLYQEPAKYARVAGLDVKEFSELMRRDANAALILFLETLQKAGGMDTLSPMFKDMGENGSRAIASLSTLATNIEAVKAQQKVANEAFDEGTSVIKEFNVQNNTVQAGMDKAAKKLNEIAVSLGQKLMPLMEHVYSSSSVMLRILSQSITFISDNFRAIVTLTAAVAAYGIAVNLAAIRTKAWNMAQAAGLAVAKAWPPVLLLWDAAFALVHGDLKLATRAMKQFSLAVKAHPLGLLVAALTAATIAIVNWRNKANEFRKAMDKASESATSFTKEIREEQKAIDQLFGTLEAAKKGTKEYDEARKDIISRYGIYLQGIINEAGEITNLTKAYERLTFAAQKSAQARGIAKAQESLDETYYSQVDTLTEKLRKSLSGMGMGERDVTRLITSVSQGIISGKDIPENTYNEIRRYTEKNMGVMQNLFGDSPMEILRQLSGNRKDYQQRSGKLTQSDPNLFRDMTREQLDSNIEAISGALESTPVKEIEVSFKVADDEMSERIADAISVDGKAPELTVVTKGAPFKEPGATASGTVTREQAEKLLNEMLFAKSQLKDIPAGKTQQQPSGPGYTPDEKGSVLNRRFREELKAVEAERERAVEAATVENAAGLSDWITYLTKKHEAQLKFYDDSAAVYRKWNKTQEEGYSQLLRQKSEEQRKWDSRMAANSIEEVKRVQRMEEIELRYRYAEKGDFSKQAEQQLQSGLYDIKIRAMKKELDLTNKGSEQYKAKEIAITEAQEQEKLRIRAHLAQTAHEMEMKYADQSAARLKETLAVLDTLLRMGKISPEQHAGFSEKAKKEADIPGTRQKSDVEIARADYARQKARLDNMLAEGLISQEEYSERVKRIQDSLSDHLISRIGQCGSTWVEQLTAMYQAWAGFAEALKSGDADPFTFLSNGIKATGAVMSAVLQSVTQLTQAELDIQTAAVEKRYEQEAAFAEGNAYLRSRLEKKKEKEIARLKSDAAKKNFAMQVASTVAATASNAVAAYGAGLQVGGMAGLILAPVAAALALAQGAVQIAVLKKQQQAASAGYAEGGFTKKGRKDQPAGIVHAGEWVASQKLVNNPRTRPVIDLLEYAQRTNNMASLSMEDVSRSISAPMAAAYYAQQPQQPVMIQVPQQTQEESGQLTEAITRLTDRLDEPFITHNSIEGPHGSKQAWDEYYRLMANKSR